MKRIILILLTAFSAIYACAATPQEKPTVQEIFVPVDHAKLFCRVMGKGDPLIVIHGGPGLSQEYLLPQLQKLSEHHLVIFYDQRGSGESLGTIDPEFIQMSTFVEDIDAIRKEFKLNKISILGHSFGGFLAMHYAIAHPEAVDKLILLNSSPATSDDYALLMDEWSRRMAPHMDEVKKIQASEAFKEGDPQTMANYLRLMYRTYCFDSRKAEELNLKMSRKSNVDGAKTFALLNENFLMKPYDLKSALQKLKCKTLIIHGDSDLIPLETAKNTHKMIPNSKLVVLKDCGHFSYVEKPQEFFDHLQTFFKEEGQR